MTEILHGVGRVDAKETLRYLGYYGVKDINDILPLLKECEKLLLPVLAPAATYSVYEIKHGKILDLGFAKTESRALEKNLKNCGRIALFAATVGSGADRLIAKYERLSPARAVVLQALGSSAIECWCDDVDGLITQKFGKTAPRFSCGYGDLPIELQRDIFSALCVTKRLGITLTENFFMVPAKSVTAIVGIENDS